MPLKHAVLRAVLTLLLALPGLAQALCLGPLCSCGVSVGTLPFGTHNPLAGSATDSSTTLSLSCGGVAGLLIPYELALNGGGSGNPATRRMTSGANTLPYGLFKDSGRSQPWGDVGALLILDSILLDVLGLSPPRQHTVYGRIPPGPTTAVPGSYSDTITVTVTYF